MTLDQAVLRAIEQKQHILLTGQGGDGKTTLLLDWWNRHAGNGELLALYVNLRTLRRTGRGIESIAEYLVRVFCGDAGTGDNDRTREEMLLRTLEAAGCPLVLLLDGLDEAAERQTVVGEIIALAAHNELKAALTMVVASRYIPGAMRTEDGKALLPGFVQYRCSPLAFSDDELSRLAGKSTAAMSPELKKLLRRPMYLALYRKYRLDQAEGEANELDCAASLLRAARRRLVDLSRETGRYERVRYILEEVLPALAYRNRNHLVFEEAELCREIEQANSKCRNLGKLYDDVIMGVLVPKGLFRYDADGHGCSQITWTHKNWAEYFAAEHVINRMHTAEQNGTVPDELLAMREDPMPMVGELLGEHRFRDKTECRSDNRSPLEAYMQRNYAGRAGRRTALAISACVKLMRMARNDKICADYSGLDTTKCVFIGSRLGKSAFKEAKIQRESFMRPLFFRRRFDSNRVNACYRGDRLSNFKTGDTRDITHLDGCRAFSIDARYFAGHNTAEGTIEVYLTRDPEAEPLAVLRDVPERVERLCFSGDGAKLIVQHQGNLLEIRELAKPQSAPSRFAVDGEAYVQREDSTVTDAERRAPLISAIQSFHHYPNTLLLGLETGEVVGVNIAEQKEVYREALFAQGITAIRSFFQNEEHVMIYGASARRKLTLPVGDEPRCNVEALEISSECSPDEVLSPSLIFRYSYSFKTVCLFTRGTIVKTITGARYSFVTEDLAEDAAKYAVKVCAVASPDFPGVFMNRSTDLRWVKLCEPTPMVWNRLLRMLRQNGLDMLTDIELRALVSSVSPRNRPYMDEKGQLLVKGRVGYFLGKQFYEHRNRREREDALCRGETEENFEEQVGMFEFPIDPKRVTKLAYFEEEQFFLAYCKDKNEFVRWSHNIREPQIWYGDARRGESGYSEAVIQDGGLFVSSMGDYGAVLSFARETFSKCFLYPLQGDGDPHHPQYYCAVEDGYTIRVYTTELEYVGKVTCMPAYLGGADFTGADFGGDDAFRDVITQNGGICE